MNPEACGPMRALRKHKSPPRTGRAFPSCGSLGATWLRGLIRGWHRVEAGEMQEPYFGGAGTNPSRLRPGSGLGFGFGAFLTSFLPLSLLPMGASVTQEGAEGKDKNRCLGLNRVVYCPYFAFRPSGEEETQWQIFPPPICRAPAFVW
jgi:hypothetical protein